MSIAQHSIPNKQGSAARFGFADALRGVAAMWVVLFHMREGHHIESLLKVLPAPVEGAVFSAGHLGVAIFFVLSGFVMRVNVGERFFGASQALAFILRRLVRLTPPYYFAMLVTVTLLFVKARLAHTPPPEVTGVQLASHLTFMTGILELPFLNIVYWTLCIEIQFYLAFALMMVLIDSLRQYVRAPDEIRTPVLGLIAAFATLWPLGFAQSTWWPGGFVGFWYSFMAGVLVGQLRSDPTVARAVCGAYILVLAACGVFRHDWFALVAATTAAALWLAQSDWFTGMPGSNWRGWAFLGMVSYSLYLFHNPVTGVVFNVLRRSGIESAWMDAFSAVIALTSCLLVSYGAYLWTERPAMNWSRNIGNRT